MACIHLTIIIFIYYQNIWGRSQTCWAWWFSYSNHSQWFKGLGFMVHSYKDLDEKSDESYIYPKLYKHYLLVVSSNINEEMKNKEQLLLFYT